LQENFQYTIIICGNRIQADLLQQLNTCNNIIYAGFVDDIIPYIQAADAFIIPSALATGIKTKMIEALANNTVVIADEANLKGIDEHIVKGKLFPVQSNNYKAFSDMMQKLEVIKQEDSDTLFYTTYYWGNIVSKAILSLQSLNKPE